MKTILVCGARPNFMKVAPLIDSIERHNASSNADSIEPILVHTGQHDLYVREMSFWLDLKLVLLSLWITLRGKWERRRR